MYWEILVTALIIMLASLVGVVSVWKQAGRVIEKNLSLLVSFSAGVFLVIAYQLSRETLEHSSTAILGAGWIVAGAILTLIVFRFIPEFHHHHDETEEDHPHSYIDARKILLGDGIHNLGDGILLAAAFSVNLGFGLLTGLSVFVHELVQETSEFFVLKQAGLTTKRAVFLNFIVSFTILMGALGGTVLLTFFEVLEVPLLGIAAGSFLVVVFHDLIPHSVRVSLKRTAHLKHAGWFMCGVVLMLAINSITLHFHEEPSAENFKLDHNANILENSAQIS